MEAKRDVIRNQRNQWFFRHIEYIQKINDNSFFDNEKLIAAAEKYCDEKSEWVLKEDQSRWVDCFKKSSNIESKSKDLDDEELAVPPFMSDKLLKMIQSKGNIKCCLKYLEYLTLRCRVKQKRLHTELGCLYIQYIHRQLRKYKKDPAAQSFI